MNKQDTAHLKTETSIHECMHTCTIPHKYIHVHRTPQHMSIHTHMHTHTLITPDPPDLPTQAHTSTHTHTHTHICTHAHTRTHIHTHTHAHAHMHTHAHAQKTPTLTAPTWRWSPRFPAALPLHPAATSHAACLASWQPDRQTHDTRVYNCTHLYETHCTHLQQWQQWWVGGTIRIQCTSGSPELASHPLYSRLWCNSTVKASQAKDTRVCTSPASTKWKRDSVCDIKLLHTPFILMTLTYWQQNRPTLSNTRLGHPPSFWWP